MPSPKSQAKVTLLPAPTVAVKAVLWPRTVGLLSVAFRPVMGLSLTVTTTVSGVLLRPKLSVTVRVKVMTVGLPGALKVGETAVELLNATDGPPACTQPKLSGV